MTKIACAGLTAFAAAVLLGYGCSNDQRHEAFDLSDRIYTEKFSCNKAFSGQPAFCPDVNKIDQIEFQNTGSNTFEVRQIPDTTGFVIDGTLSGLVFTWTATSPKGYTESGVWTFTSSGGEFQGPSHYVADDGSYSGDCNTNGRFGLSSPSAPPFPAGCP